MRSGFLLSCATRAIRFRCRIVTFLGGGQEYFGQKAKRLGSMNPRGIRAATDSPCCSIVSTRHPDGQPAGWNSVDPRRRPNGGHGTGSGTPAVCRPLATTGFVAPHQPCACFRLQLHGFHGGGAQLGLGRRAAHDQLVDPTMAAKHRARMIAADDEVRGARSAWTIPRYDECEPILMFASAAKGNTVLMVGQHGQ